MPLARNLGATLVVALSGLGTFPVLAGAVAADAAAKRCAASQVAMTFDARKQTLTPATTRRRTGIVCLRRPSKPRAAGKTGEALGRGVWPRGPRYRKVRRSSTFRRVAPAAGSALAKVRAGARISSRSVTTQSGPMPEFKRAGVREVTTKGTHEKGDATDEVGSFTEAEVTAVGEGPGSPTVTATTGSGAISDRCPSKDGLVRGSVRSKTGESRSVVSGGLRAFLAWELEYETVFVAKVNEDARAASMDVTITGSFTFRSGIVDARTGRTVKHEPTRVFRLFATRTGVDPHNTSERPGEDFFAQRTWNARGPKGTDVLTNPKLREEMVNLLALMDAFGTNKAAAAVLQAEQYWYGEGQDIETHSDGAARGKDGSLAGHCIKLVFDPTPAVVEPGQAASVSTRVMARDGSEVTRAKLTLAPVTGAVAPATGTFTAGGPLAVTWTAPRPKLYDGDFASFNATATSIRGRARSSHTARHPVTRRFTVHLTGTQTAGWDIIKTSDVHVGTDSECRSRVEGNGGDLFRFTSEPPPFDGSASFYGETFYIGSPRVGGTTARRSSGQSTFTGPGCASPGTTPFAASGCGEQAYAPFFAGLEYNQATQHVELNFDTGYGAPDFDPCEQHYPQAGHYLDNSLLRGSSASLPLSALRDDARDTITVNGSTSATGHEGCDDNGGQGGCEPSPHRTSYYDITAEAHLNWTLTLTRVK